MYVHDLVRGVTSRLTDGGHEWHPSWTPDGGSVIFDSTEQQTSCTYKIAPDGSRAPERILERGSVCAHSSPDGSVVFMRVGRGTPEVAVQRADTGKAVVLGHGVEPQVSPDGDGSPSLNPAGLELLYGRSERYIPAFRSRVALVRSRDAGRGGPLPRPSRWNTHDRTFRSLPSMMMRRRGSRSARPCRN